MFNRTRVSTLLGFLVPVVIQLLFQVPISGIYAYYAPVLQQVPLLPALTPLWGIAAGTVADNLALEAIERGWITSPPSLAATLQAAVRAAGIGFALSFPAFVVGFPSTFGVAGLPIFDSGLALVALIPLVVLMVVCPPTTLLLLRLLIAFGAAPRNLILVARNVTLTIVLLGASFEAARFALERGWL